jgi:large subunit ribosomal protein L4
MELKVINEQGQEAAKLQASDVLFGRDFNEALVHQIVVAYQANARSADSKQKDRSEVRHTTTKPWRQKGTGRARQGSTRAGQWKGGGVIFGPTPRSYAFKVPNKVVKLAMRSVLSAKRADEQLFVIDSFGLDKPNTKQAAAVLKALGIDRRVTVVIDNDDTNAYLSLRNIEKVRVITASEANTYDLVDNVSVLFTKPALEWLEGVLS